ncbi:MAG TPA: branched-chain amino acid ABC transporter substrate-binding protein [Solirubrobacteraceae bacterium]|jgi:branched-chain amino acid transport system substrate-binding protein|nr:branched-chain amino acid ABC transporter substrate-binding protein [Solirubrobacteraceae bacterium]
MPGGLRAASACVLALLAFAAAGCGGDGAPDNAPADGPRTLTIYSSLPLHGPDRERARDMVNAIKLALQESGGKIGPLSVTYVSLDSSTAEDDTWTQDKVLDNARTAVKDFNSIAYIGDLDSAATALSLPLTNEGHVLQVSPSSTYDGLTRAGGRRPAEPERFYPSGLRTFGRVVPADHVTASALVGYMKSEGVRRLALLADRDLYGGGLADQIEKAAARQGIDVEDRGRIDARKRDLGDTAADIAKQGADAFVFAGGDAAGAARIYQAVADAAPGLLLFGPDAVADDPAVLALPAAVLRRLRVTSALLPLRMLPRAARTFDARFDTTFGRHPAPAALQAYEATRAVLAAIRNAGAKGNNRRAVTDAFFATRDRPSVLGTYSIDRNGDTSLSTFAGNRLTRSGPVLDKVLKIRR